MLIVSNMVSKWSGSLNGVVGSHNKGGMYLRQRSTPTNPNTIFQQTIRNAVKILAAAWSNTLTAAQRNDWATYATNQPLTNKLGEARTVTPLDMYIRSNVPRIQAGLAIVAAGPTNFTLPVFTPPTMTLVAATDIASISFSVTDAWATENGGAMYIYLSRPQSVGINYFRGPYRFLTVIPGAVAPPTSPATATSPFNYAAGNKGFWRVQVSRADGRLSAAQFFTVVAT